MDNITEQGAEYQSTKVSYLPQIKVSRWVYDKLCKIQAARGVPLEIWAGSELIKAIDRVWDFKENGPKRLSHDSYF